MRPFALIVLLLTSAAGAGEKEDIFKKFDHKAHASTFGPSKLTCLACHEVGGGGPPEATGDQLADAWLMPPRASCHQCHAPGQGGLGEGASYPMAPKKCETCHANVKAPPSHGPDWPVFHGMDAEGNAATCRDCHERRWCADCHDRRDDATKRVHDPSWLSVHGIAARASANSCDSCHVQAECTTCHASSAGYGRTP